MNILGIETSCDETAAAVVCDANDAVSRIRSNIVFSQISEHIEYGGVVPEIAARAHLHYIRPTIESALLQANLTLNDIDGIAVTSGPGLIGGVLVGLMAAKAIAMTHNIPFLGINHLEGHALTVRLTNNVPYPYLLLLISGGHCQFVAVESLGSYRVLGRTLDDAAGEAFDKVAKMMDVGYPGGPAIEQLAKTGNSERFVLPRPLIGRKDCNFSFSGLKTSVRTLLGKGDIVNRQDKADLAASFQKVVADHIIDRASHALSLVDERYQYLVVAGGVAANEYIRNRLNTLACKRKRIFVAPPIKLCTDNAAMIAWAGLERFEAGLTSEFDISPKPRWPLESLKI
ncbi:MAG: tRNA (adenosine(37)-N6)-threonylcarbamoyltransferase complex transferase subunit TsaD [Candidatus Paracaedibacteraceae bacterium]|nr:tRNA (adenosine(37)-N6)-threonylcarbamoyltransferase complex transferase subunit TsaD [Candidatus Paracaedibacteraceae bacterium]